MTLNDRYRHIQGKETGCDLCGKGLEDLEHFLITCESLEGKRDRTLIDRNRNEDIDEWIGNILWKEKDMGKVKKMVGEMWQRRCVLRKRMGLEAR